MNVTNTSRVPQYEVERSIRAVKAATEQTQEQGIQTQGLQAQTVQAQAIQAAPNTQAVAKPEAAAQGTEAVGGAGQVRAPQMDAYIPQSPRAPIVDDTAEQPAPAGVLTRPTEGEAGPAFRRLQNSEETEGLSDRLSDREAVSVKSEELADSLKFSEADQDPMLRVFEDAAGTVASSSTTDLEDAEGIQTTLQQSQPQGNAVPGKSSATYNTNQVDREVQGIKSRLEEVQRQIRSGRSIQEAEKLENEAVQLRRELLWKSTDAYRRQSAVEMVS